MTIELAMVTLDCAEVGPEAGFWAALLGWDVVADDGENYAMLAGGGGAALGLGKVEDYAPPAWPNEHGSKQFHFDLKTDDIPAAEAEAVELGATLADPQPGETWRVLLSPAGHRFCLTDAKNWGEPSGMTTPDPWTQVPRLLADNAYCVLATADEDGTPWATPVYFAAAGHDTLFWVSSARSRHSHNLTVRPDVAITVFDSTVPVGGAEALYLTARAAVCDDVAAALATMNAKLPAGKGLTPDDLSPTGPLTAYRAAVLRIEVLVRGGDPAIDEVVDGRLEVRPPGS